MGEDVTVVPADSHKTDSLQLPVLIPKAVSQQAEQGTGCKGTQGAGISQASGSC